MNDSEIINGLQRMSSEDPDGFSSVVLDLIKRQQAEITKMSGAISYLESAYTSVADEVKVKTVQEFAEKLKEYCNEIANQEWNKRTLPVSWADAYEDFIDDIDRLLEEMGCNDG